MQEGKIRSQLESLNKNDSVRSGLFVGHYFFGAKDTITRLIKKRYKVENRRQIKEFKKSFEPQHEGKPFNIEDKIIIRTWALRDREKNDKRFNNLFMSCVDLKTIYSSWEIQTDLHILENVEMGILSYKKQQAIIVHSSKAGMAAVESRNLSHNIGSHVLARWISELDLHLRGQSDWEDKDIIEESKRLYEYIQTRMDFIAEISTSVPSWEMSDYFSEIADELIGQNILRAKIASSEGYKNIGIKIEVSPGCERVSIPNGHVGKHAFFSIIENFVRNAAKHYAGQARSDELDLSIQLKKVDDERYRDKYIEMVIQDLRKNSCNKETYQKLTSYLLRSKKESRFADSNGIILPGGWGIKEMILAGNFLRKNSPEDLITGSSQNEPPIIQINCSLTENQRCNRQEKCVGDSSGHLGMSFLLRRPKDLCVISSVGPKIVANDFEIDFLELAKLEENPFMSIPHRLALVSDMTIKHTLEKNPTMPMRVACNTCDKINDESYLDLYEAFIRDDLNNGNQLPTLCWLEADANGYNNRFCKSKIDMKSFSKYLSGDADCTVKHINFLIHPEENDHKDKVDYLINNKGYLQPLSAAFSSQAKLDGFERYKTENYKRHFLLELIESAVTRIAIIDERINDFSSNIAFRGIPKRKLLENMGIFVLDIDNKNITHGTLAKKWDDLRKTAEKYFSSEELHFVIIHQGILDKLEKEKKGNSRLFIENLNCRWKIVDSGRGIPKEFKEKSYKDMRFIEISTVSKLIEQYDKHALVQTLYSIRRPIINNENEV